MTELLKPTTFEKLTLPSGKIVSVPKYEISFSLWDGDAIKDSDGNKQVLKYKGSPLFAELVVLNILKDNGWDGVWVDSYRKYFRISMPGDLKEKYELPQIPAKLFKKITNQTGFKGCWDVFAWKGNEFLFVECKRKGKDKIRDSQLVWLETCLRHKMSLSSFLLVEWALSSLKDI